MFPALLCPSSGAHDYNVDYHIGRLVLGLLTSNLQQPKNETTNVVINTIVLELLMMGIVMLETC